MKKNMLSAAMLLLVNGLFSGILAPAFAAGPATLSNGLESLYRDLPVALEAPALPQIPEGRVCLADFGAVGNGVTDCTRAFSDAIARLESEGGGHLDVPRGVWLTGPIVLKSRIDLHLEDGALVIFTADKRAYFPDAKADADLASQVPAKKRAVPCISAQKCTDISITGNGILDGNGKYWRYSKRDKLSDVEWKELKRWGGKASEDGKFWYPAELDEAVRQHMVVIKHCQRVLLQGVTVQNSPKFHVFPSECTDVVIDGITVRCPWNAQNGDGIDISNSRRVLVTRCTVDAGDDGICLKGGSGASGLKAGPCSDILICGNVVFHAHGGFVIGSDVSGGMRRIVVKDCNFSGTDTGLRFKSAMGRGGHCEDIFISNIMMNDIREAAVTLSCDYADITYKNRSDAAGKTDFAPDFCGIHISNVVCRECPVAVYAHGISGLNCVHDIDLSSSTFLYLDKATDIDESTASIAIDKVEFVKR